MIKKIVVLVVDALGVGFMEDVVHSRPVDIGVNTLLNISKSAGPLNLPVLESMGLGNIAIANGLKAVGENAIACYGRNKLAHVGADTYMGHQEIMGSAIKPIKRQLMNEVGAKIRQELELRGFKVKYLLKDKPILEVDNCCVVADNVEGEVAMNINVTGALDLCTFEKAVKVGLAVRAAVEVSRVIVCCSNGFNMDDVKKHITISADGQYGVDTPGLGVYNKTYQVRHIGCGVDAAVQGPTLVKRVGKSVDFIGKTADIIDCEGARYYPVVDTEGVFNRINKSLDEIDEGLIYANIQETDLAGHAEDAPRWRNLLHTVDRNIGNLIKGLAKDDLLIICGDHGNDPAAGHSHHTREYTPLLVYRRGIKPVSLGDRETLADIGTTVCRLLGAEYPAYGHSFAKQIM